jgi:N,N'-diacetylchitobiose transport system substrate-binding protein
VLDIGNTQVSTFAATGGLMDVTQYKKDLEQGQTWLGGLLDPATIDGKLYGVPSFGAARAAIYNKDIWAKAGVTQVPTTFAELKQDLDKIKAANAGKKNFSAFYLPGTNWYAAMQFVWDAGGEIATKSGGQWAAGFSTPEAQKGLQEWKTIQNTYSAKSSQTLKEDNPQQGQLLGNGDVATVVGNAGGDLALAVKTNPKGHFGAFPIPGASGQNQPTLLAGSDWGIAQKSQNKMLALAWVKIAASAANQL